MFFPEKPSLQLSDLPSLCHNMVICLKKSFGTWKRWLCFCSKHKGSFHIFVCITHLKVNKIFQRRVLNHVYHAANISWCLTSHDCALPSTITLYHLKEFQNIFLEYPVVSRVVWHLEFTATIQWWKSDFHWNIYNILTSREYQHKI